MPVDATAGLIPRPTTVTVPGAGALVIAHGLRVTSTPELAELVTRFVADVAGDTGILLRPATYEPGEPCVRLEIVDTLDVAEAAHPSAWLSPDGTDRRSEAYRLEVSESGVLVQALHSVGLFRGLASLRQLISGSVREEGERRASLLPVVIDDAPRHGWRGLNVDVGRTFLTVDELTAIVDLLALYKLNVLHLHLTENVGWRLEIDGWPDLVTPGEYYTKADYARLVAYAQERFVTVVPEIDIPGHTRAAVEAYPELGALLPGGFAWLDTSPAALRFVDAVLSQVAELTPGDYLHIGADEPFGMPTELYHEFLERVLPLGERHGKKLVGWQEASRALSPGLAAVQYWIDRDFPALMLEDPGHDYLTPEMFAAVSESFAGAADDLARAVARGAAIILSPTAHAYLDLPYLETPAAEQAPQFERLGHPLYPPTDIRYFYDWNQGDGLPAGAVGSGVEGAIWGESTQTLADVQFLVLPRLAGIAEHAWAESAQGWDEYAPRLRTQPALWRRRGWNFFDSPLLRGAPD